MTRDQLAIAVAEAKRFVERAEALPPPESRTLPGGAPYLDLGFPPKSGGAIRRASLDLTRALADLRRSS
jgi:hypothetical protein